MAGPLEPGPAEGTLAASTGHLRRLRDPRIAPTKGIALPLVSSGGTGWCLTAFSIGLLAAIDRENARGEREAADRDAATAEPAAPAALPVGAGS